MPRRPIASAIHEQSGAYAKNPQRRNKNEPKPKLGWPDMPDYVEADDKARACWFQVCSALESMSILAVTDTHIIASYCMDYSQWQWLNEMVKEGNVTDIKGNGEVKVSAYESQLHKYADRILKRQAELGLTPSSRVKLHAPKKEEEDEFQAWMKRAMGSDN